MNDRMSRPPRVIIVGGGFGGLAAARALADAPVQVTVIDRRNHHVFQPLLYQVATAALSPADIASPIRSVLRNQENCQVVLAEVTGVHLQRSRLYVGQGWVEYDWLVLAAGATHSYFGHNEWERYAPGLKTIEDATEIRRRILLAFEAAEYEADENARRAALTFAIVGGGPTGVELAGAIKEIAAQTIPRDFRNIDTRTTRVLLLEGGERLLPAFHPELSERARNDLEALGVEVRLNALVTDVSERGVHINGEFLPVSNVLWAAGVKASPLTTTLDVPLARGGQVIVEPDLSVPGHPNVFVVGDMAAARSAGTGELVPGVAQGALQGGRHAGQIIAREVWPYGATVARPPFVYRDKGSLATIGRARAVAQIGGRRITGLLAWLLWSGVHILFLIEFRNRVVVALNWIWNWLAFARGARLITGDAQLVLEQVGPDVHLPDRADAAAAPTTNDDRIATADTADGRAH